MVFINKLADHSHHDDLRVDDELVVQNLKLPANATVEACPTFLDSATV